MTRQENAREHLGVLIVGAGLSEIGSGLSAVGPASSPASRRNHARQR